VFEPLIYLLLLILGVSFLGTGVERRREDGRGDGVAGILIGSGLLALLGLLVLGSFFVAAVDDSTSSSSGIDTTQGMSDITMALDGADRYLRAIDQVRVTGTIDQTHVDMTFVDDDDAVGTIRSGATRVRLIRVDGDTFIKPSDDFWSGSPDPRAAMDFVDGRWIRLDPDDARFDDLTDVPDRDELRKPLTGAWTYTGGTPARIHGLDCIAINLKPGSGVLYIARSPDRLVRVDDGSGFVGDLDYDAPTVTPAVPSRVVDSSEVFASNSVA
jgi:hypothetical protein